jgi:hypothetical protein
MKTLRDLRRVGPVNPRVAGRARMDRGFEHAIEHMRLSGAMTPCFVADNETAVMRMHLDDIGGIIDEAIADDHKAGLLMRTIGYALDRASGLGRVEGEHQPGSELRARREKRRIPGLICLSASAKGSPRPRAKASTKAGHPRPGRSRPMSDASRRTA